MRSAAASLWWVFEALRAWSIIKSWWKIDRQSLLRFLKELLSDGVRWLATKLRMKSVTEDEPESISTNG